MPPIRQLRSWRVTPIRVGPTNMYANSPPIVRYSVIIIGLHRESCQQRNAHNRPKTPRSQEGKLPSWLHIFMTCLNNNAELGIQTVCLGSKSSQAM